MTRRAILVAAVVAFAVCCALTVLVAQILSLLGVPWILCDAWCALAGGASGKLVHDKAAADW